MAISGNIFAAFGSLQPDPLYIGIIVATCVLLISGFVISGVGARRELRRRLSTSTVTNGNLEEKRSIHFENNRRIAHIAAKAGKLFSPNSKAELTSMRRQLVQAGFLAPSALPIYYSVRILVACGLPALLVIFYRFLPFELPSVLLVLFAGGFAVAGLIIPGVVLDWRRSMIRERYRHAFPDMMDLLVVCMESGQSLHAAIDRVGREMFETCPQLGANMHMLSLEMRAGRTLPDCLDGLHDRLGIEEVKSLKLLLKQSQELGASIATTLRVYSDDMRDKRLMNAETRANALPVKLTLPLGMFIFPVILLLILAPIVMRIKASGLF